MTEATTQYGQIEGMLEDGVHAYKGVPFAKSPTGALRWAPPEAPDHWQGVKQTLAFGPGSIQAESAMSALFPEQKKKPVFNEDCLTLNVWSPVDADGSNPVMVWIHGGAFTQGSGGSPMYDGTTFAKRGAVLVTVNYRLGALGFLRLVDVTGGAIGATGIEGIQDQMFALQWVQNNIAGFGGNPENVTIFGESAGGMSVGALMGIPSAQGLYHKAIPQSGAGHNAVSIDRANKVADLLLEKLGIPADDVDRLRISSADEILQAQQALQADVSALRERSIEGMAFQPVIDGHILTRLPVDAVRDGVAKGKGLFIGNTEEENKLFVGMGMGQSQLDDAGLRDQLSKTHGEQHADALLSVYAETLQARGAEPSPFEINVAIGTDQIFRVPAIRLAEAQQNHCDDVYVYLFDWKTNAFGGRLGSCHALEIPFVFASHQSPGLVTFAGGDQPGADALADSMQSAWVAFAATGNPGANTSVAAYSKNRTTMIFGKDNRIEEDPAAASREVWDLIDTAL